MKKSILVTLCAAFMFSARGFPQSLSPTVKDYKTKTGKIFTVTESHPVGASLSNITVALSGIKGAEIKYSDADPINKVLVADLDGNGFDEIYIITLSAGSGSYGNVIGVASLKDKSISMITFPEVGENDLKKGAPFEGYEGHDLYTINKNILERIFPVKTPKSGQRKILYKLQPKEAGYLLVIQILK